MIRLKIRLDIRHDGVMTVCAIEDKTAIVVVASYRSVSRNSVRFKALTATLYSRRFLTDFFGKHGIIVAFCLSKTCHFVQ